MSDADTATQHPSPARENADVRVLFFGIGAAPILWALHVALNFAVASHSCFPGSTTDGNSNWTPMWIILLLSDIVTIAVGLTGGSLAWRAWRGTRHEQEGGQHHLLEAGEGRTRFLALCGMLASFGFAVAILFDVPALFIVRSCQ
jgi:hypothetical protein